MLAEEVIWAQPCFSGVLAPVITSVSAFYIALQASRLPT